MTYRGHRRRGRHGEGMSGVALDLLLMALPVAFTMFVVLNFGGILTLGRAQAVGHHAGPDRRQPREHLRHPRPRPAPSAGRRDQDADQGRLHAGARRPADVHAGAVRVGLLRAGRLRLDPLRRHAHDRRARDPAPGGDAERRHPLRAGDALPRRLRAHDGGLVLGQQLRAPGRPARRRAHDLGGDRHRRLDHGRGDGLRLAQHAGHRARPGACRSCRSTSAAGFPPGAS